MNNNQFDGNEMAEFPSQLQASKSMISVVNPESVNQSRKPSQVQSPQQPWASPNQMSVSSYLQNAPENIPISYLGTSQTQSYLNIDFRDILALIFSNQCPQLNFALKSVVHRSSNLVNFAAIFMIVMILSQVLALYLSIISEDELKELFSVYFCFKILSDGLLTYILCQLRYCIAEAHQLHQGSVCHCVIEYLKYTIRIHQPLDDAYLDEMQSQAQQVGNIISTKITTFKWLTFLLESWDSHIFALSRIYGLSMIILFIWGNITLIQWFYLHWSLATQVETFFPLLIMLTIFSMNIGYLIILGLSSVALLVCAGIPVLICLVLWQSCNWLQVLYHNVREHYLIAQRNRFINSLVAQPYQTFKQQDANVTEECSICLCDYEPGEYCIKLPCNVNSTNGAINHVFHEGCIRVWLEECGSCPICRTRFVARID